MNNPSELWMRRDHKHDLAFRPLETALLSGKVDAIYTQSKVFQHLQEATGQIKMIEDLSRYPDWTIQVANTPGRHHLHRRDGRRAPRARRRLHEGDDQGRALGERATSAPPARSSTGRRSTGTPRTPTRASSTSTWCPSLSAQNLQCDRDRQGLHAQPRLHQARLRRGRVGAERVEIDRSRERPSGSGGSPPRLRGA